jgi:DNA-binding NarL/FixJ family response regulator
MTSNISTVQEQDSGGEPTSAKILVVIEDDPDVQFLIEAIFAMDPRFSVTNVAESAEEALEAPATSEPGIIVLDHGLAGPLPGLAAAPMLKELAPQAKIIMFTAHAALQARADKEPAIDAFLLKTESEKLLPLAQKLIGLSPTLP